MKEIPNGWILTELHEISLLTSGTGFPDEYQNKTGLKYPFFKVGNLKDVNSNELLLSSSHSIDNNLVHVLKAKIIPEGSILFAKIGMAIRLNRRRQLGVPACIDNNMMAAIPTNAVLSKYLLRFLETVDLMPFTQATTVPSLRKGDLDKIRIPLPPLNEQRRIVAKLDEILSRVESCRARLDLIPGILKRFRQSVLAAACSGRLTADWREENPDVEPAEVLLEKVRERRYKSVKTDAQLAKVIETFAAQEESEADDLPAKWKYIALAKLAKSFDYGTSAKSGAAGEIPVLRMGNLQNGEIDWRDLVYTSDQNEIDKYALSPRTVLFNRTNSPELVGKTSIYRGGRPAIFAGYLIRINNEPELEPEYLNFSLNTLRAKEFCLDVKTDGVSQSALLHESILS